MSKRRNDDGIDNTKSYSALPFKISKSNLEITFVFQNSFVSENASKNLIIN
jgi:hypothetical protein